MVAAHLDDLVARPRTGLAALDGDTLVHCDIRADNMLITPGRHAGVVVDWPWGSRRAGLAGHRAARR